MDYTRTATNIRFNTRIDEVRIEKVENGYKIFADAEDREAIYFLGDHQTTAVADALQMATEENFLDFVESAIKAGKKNEVFSAAIENAKSEFFWMNMDQIDRYLIGGEQPGEIDKE